MKIFKKKCVLLEAAGRPLGERKLCGIIDTWKVKYFTKTAFLFQLTVLWNTLILLDFSILTALRSNLVLISCWASTKKCRKSVNKRWKSWETWKWPFLWNPTDTNRFHDSRTFWNIQNRPNFVKYTKRLAWHGNLLLSKMADFGVKNGYIWQFLLCSSCIGLHTNLLIFY